MPTFTNFNTLNSYDSILPNISFILMALLIAIILMLIIYILKYFNNNKERNIERKLQTHYSCTILINNLKKRINYEKNN